MTPGHDDFDELLAETTAHIPEFIGLSGEQATGLANRLEVQLRVTISENRWVTADYHPRRITVHVEDGLVVSAHAG